MGFPSCLCIHNNELHELLVFLPKPSNKSNGRDGLGNILKTDKNNGFLLFMELQKGTWIQALRESVHGIKENNYRN